MWPPSLSLANKIFDVANIFFISSLVIGVVATIVIVRLAAVKERYWEEERDSANLKIAELNKETAQLTADNISLQTVMLPRHAGLIGINEEPPAKKYFAGMEKFGGINVAIQTVEADKEAKNLANEVFLILMQYGLRPYWVSDRNSNVPDANIGGGVRVAYPMGEPFNPARPRPTWLNWHDAAEAIANALTAAGLGIGSFPVERYGFQNSPPAPAISGFVPYFFPPLEGVYLQVGSRPISETIGWIKAGRPDAAGVPTAPIAK